MAIFAQVCCYVIMDYVKKWQEIKRVIISVDLAIVVLTDSSPSQQNDR